MKIARGQVQHIAELARLEFKEDELDSFTNQLDKILTYFDTLREVDTDLVEPTSHAIVMRNVFREDALAGTAPRGSAPSGSALANAPDRYNDCFRVPKIIE